MPSSEEYSGLRVYPRDYRKTRKPSGRATGTTYPCRMEGCTGVRVMVRWPDGKVTWPCSKGMGRGPYGKSLVIL